MNELENAILRTLAYADVFHYPLTADEIFMRCISAKPHSAKSLQSTLHQLNLAGKISHSGSYYYLPSQAPSVKSRLHRQQTSRQKLDYAVQIAAKLQQLPYVQAVFLTGAVAVGNAPKNDDIDVCIITSTKSLWTARLLVNLWLDWHHLRRHPQAVPPQDSICPNLFLSTSTLTVPHYRQSLYTAHEVIQAVPISDPHGLYRRFLAANSWVTAYLPHQEIPTLLANNHELKAPAVIETICQKIQMWYMKYRITREIVTAEAAYFHPRDTAKLVLNQYAARLHRYNVPI